MAGTINTAEVRCRVTRVPVVFALAAATVAEGLERPAWVSAGVGRDQSKWPRLVVALFPCLLL